MKPKIALAVTLAALCQHVCGHSRMTTPPSRTRLTCRRDAPSQTNSAGALQDCPGPCDSTTVMSSRQVVQRGQEILVAWPRNQHPGGFVRLAWAPTSESGKHSAFNGGVQKFACYEVGPKCHSSDPNDPLAIDNDGEESNACYTKTVVPAHFDDGEYTLQWAYFGSSFRLGDYHSCTDMVVSGGIKTRAAPPAPIFEGGDAGNPRASKCSFFNTDRLGVCVLEPCDDPANEANRKTIGNQFPAQKLFNGIPFWQGAGSSPGLKIIPPREPKDSIAMASIEQFYDNINEVLVNSTSPAVLSPNKSNKIPSVVFFR